jgi:hypothetical protein
MNVRGPCSSCGAPLATDQRYCVECGQRVGPPLALPYALPSPAVGGAAPVEGRMLRLPIPPEMAGLLAALALGFGVVLGTAISPNLAGIVAAPAPPVVAQAPPESPAPASRGGGGGSPGPAPAAAPAATVPATTPTESSGGGGGGQHQRKKKNKKKKPAAGIEFSGTVVRANPVAQSYTVSTGTGLVSIHAETLPKVGDQVESTVRKLNNGTYAESATRNPVGTADVASFQGTVTYCADLEQPAAACDGGNPTDHYVYAVSFLGASVLVSWPHTASAPPPQVGSRVQVAVSIGEAFKPIEPLDSTDWASYSDCNPSGGEQFGVPEQTDTVPELTQTSITPSGPATSATLEAVVQTVCPTGLVLSADDIREAGRDLPALGVPAGIDPARLGRGQAVQVAVDVADGGALTLRGLTSDQGATGADDAGQGQGTLTGS